MLLLCLLFIAGVALQRDAKILNHTLTSSQQNKDQDTNESSISQDIINKIPTLDQNIVQQFDLDINAISKDSPGLWTLSKNHYILSTYPYNTKTYGYAGNTPLFIEIKDNKIKKIIAAENDETPGFWNRVIQTKILDSWNGLSLKEVSTIKVDAVSGATYSSTSIIENIENTARNFTGLKAPSVWIKIFTIKNIACLLTLILGILLTFFAKGKKIRIFRLCMNIVVLGFWCGQTLSLSAFVNSMSNGMSLSNNIVLIALILVAIVLPFFGKKRYYCNHVCPYGSAQELMNKIPIKNIKINSKIIHYLNYLRYIILGLILILMWTGVTFKMMNYEPFSAFIFQTASTGVLILAISFLLLSVFIPKPYCRFVCPTGALLSMSDNTAK